MEKEIVMKSITAIAHFVAVTLISTGCALAQDRVARATVPFDFTLNGTSLPAGTYEIGTRIDRPSTLSIKNRQGQVNLWAMGLVNTSEPAQTGSLVFHKCGDQYFLSEIHYPGASRKVIFPASKAEKRAMEHRQDASLNPNSDTLIALN